MNNDLRDISFRKLVTIRSYNVKLSTLKAGNIGWVNIPYSAPDLKGHTRILLNTYPSHASWVIVGGGYVDAESIYVCYHCLNNVSSEFSITAFILFYL